MKELERFSVEIGNHLSTATLCRDTKFFKEYIVFVDGKKVFKSCFKTAAKEHYKATVNLLKFQAMEEVLIELDLEDQEREGKKSLSDAIKYCNKHDHYSVVVGRLPNSFKGNLDCVKDCFFDRDIDNWVAIINVYKLRQR